MVDNELLKLVNSSGFIFQIGVLREIERTFSHHKWDIVAEEHRWKHPESGENGFIDLVIKRDMIFRIVIECKRATGRNWVFLTPRNYSKPSDTVSLFWTDRIEPDQDVWGWIDLLIQPGSPESAFCVVQGQGDGQTPMLERIADILLPSVEAVALEELSFKPNKEINRCHLFVPILVTNAQLYTCSFNPEQVDMIDGKLPTGEFKNTPFIRFRKGLATYYQVDENAGNLSEAHKFKERTLLVVNASSLAAVLGSFSPDRDYTEKLSQLIFLKRK